MNRYCLVILFFLTSFLAEGQEVKTSFTGQVSFVSSQNIYVRFKSTTGINAGDTLFISTEKGLTPALIVNSLSSSSCMCTPLEGINLVVSSAVTAKVRVVESARTQVQKESDLKAVTAADSSEKNNNSVLFTQRIRGSVSINSYNDFSNTTLPNSQRMRYSLSLDAKNIAGSGFSFSTYTTFRHKIGEWQEIQDNIFNGLKIFDLSLKYDPGKSFWILAGRKINPRIANAGAIDGIQAEKTIGNFSAGIIAGFRPDFSDYSINTNLLQYGGYISLDIPAAINSSSTSLAFLQQMNGSATDRRFIYFQQTAMLWNKLTILASAEVDLYKLVSDTVNGTSNSSGTFDLTGLYISAGYRVFKSLSLSLAYDARKNVMYYETYKNFTDRILENELRQGFRLQANYDIIRNLHMGIQAGYRYLKSDPHPSRNLNTWLTYTAVPILDISSTLSATFLETGYINGNIYGLSVSKDFANGKFDAGAGYRYVDYTLPENSLSVPQNMCEISFSWQVVKKLFLSMNYEGTFEKEDAYNRFYIQLRRRF